VLWPTSPAISWPDIVGRFTLDSLLRAEFDWDTALSLALASKLANDTADSVSSTSTSLWSFDECTSLSRDDAQCFVASCAECILVAFRGTESIGDWLADLNIFSVSRPYGVVHRGFYGQFLVLSEAIERLIRGQAQRPLVLTGHSLGGALATVAAAEWQDRFPIRCVYTFGQPAVGRGAFSQYMADRFPNNFIRIVNRNDIVPRVPPNFRHVGKLVRIVRGGISETFVETPTTLAEPPMLTELEFDRLRAQLLNQRAAKAMAMESPELEAIDLAGWLPSIVDHSIDNYLAQIIAKMA
jgi:hypothetical protein